MVRKISLKNQKRLREHYYNPNNQYYYAKVDKFYEGLRQENIKISKEQLINWLQKQRIKGEKYLYDIYYNINKTGSFSTPDQLYKEVIKEGKFKFSHAELKKWLATQHAYLLHKLVKRQFRTSRTIFPPIIGFMLDIDTAIMTKYTKSNQGFGFLLVGCDPMSLKIYVSPMEFQTGESVLHSFKKIISKLGKNPKLVRMDKHASFKSKVFLTYLKQNKISYQFVYNISKAVFAELAIRSMKLKIARFLSFRNDDKYIPWLQQLVDNHNNLYSTTLGCAPAEVTNSNVYEVWLRRFLPYSEAHSKAKIIKHAYKIGQRVHLSVLKGTFTRQTDRKWTSEVFRIVRRFHRDGLPLYILSSEKGEKILGSFYQKELSPVS